MNKIKLQQAMIGAGVKTKELADSLGIKSSAFNRKVRLDALRTREISIIAKVLCLTQEQFCDIFLH